MTERWGMVVDVNRCVGCQTCTIACKHWNDTQPGVQWRKVLDVETGTFPDVERLFLVVGCQHCAEPPCVPVCPTGATQQREDGLVTMDYDVCIGCAYCAVSCPYQARTIAHDHNWYYGHETIQEDAVRHREREGVAQKCTFCVDKIDDAKARGLTPGVDPDVTPACSASCIAQAIHFGDFNDPGSNVSQLVEQNPYFQMHEHLGTDPQIKYLYSTPAVPGRAPAADEWDDERMSDPENALVGERQTFWDWRAAMNWCFGGLSSGFVVVAWLAALTGAMPMDDLRIVNVIGGAIMAVGLFFVWLKIGRRFRAWRAIARPHTSWMTRELYAVALFYLTVLIGLVAPHPLVFAATGVLALAFLVCQAKILHMAKGIPAWREPLVPWMIALTGLLEGAAAYLVYDLVYAGDLGSGAHALLIALTLVLTAVTALVWGLYVDTAEEQGIPPLARAVLRRTMLNLLTLGHGVPALLLIVAAVVGGFGLGDTTAQPLASLVFVAALLVVFGGLGWKYAMVVDAGYQQGYALGMLPQRGSGARAAPRLAPATRTAA